MIKSRKEFIEIYRQLEELNETYNKKVLYCIFKNKQLLKEILEIVIKKESEIISNEYKEFQTKRRNLLLTYCERDSNNNPIIENEQFIIKQEYQITFNEMFNKLFDENKDVLIKYDNDKKHFMQFIDELVDIDIIKFSFNDLPENMSVERFNLLSIFIKENEEELSKLV